MTGQQLKRLVALIPDGAEVRIGFAGHFYGNAGVSLSDARKGIFFLETWSFQRPWPKDGITLLAEEAER